MKKYSIYNREGKLIREIEGNSISYSQEVIIIYGKKDAQQIVIAILSNKWAVVES